MIETNEVLLRNGDSWLHFFKPYRVVTTKDLSEVRDALNEVESLVNQQSWHAAGFVSYEAAPAFERAVRVLDSGEFPLLWFGLYPEPKNLESLPQPTHTRVAQASWEPMTSRESYNTSIEKIKEHIAEGRTYQVNYTMRLKTDFSSDAWNFFLHLAQNQNRYASFVNTEKYAICSASPELFFQLDGENITSQPMKGTAKRGRTTAEDKELSEWLHFSVKNRAENVMIVDMIRNELGRIAKIGSVEVPELFRVEKYPTLFQMTSTVTADTHASIAEIFSALFPCPSITGAPKISTMNLISQLETMPRKLYTGSIGSISPDRKARFNVAIRTAIIDKDSQSAEYGMGGGVVWDSTANDEYDEALLKSRVLIDRQKEFSLLETIGWSPKAGYFLLEKHIARMADSANYFDFAFSQKKLEDLLDHLAKNFKSHHLIRILLSRSGELRNEAKEFTPQRAPFKVKLADCPIDSSNAFFFHKTTNREIYPTESQNTFDEILLYNEKGELTEFAIGNLVVKMNGGFFTPPVVCGLLAGTFRAHLLETGQVKERVLHKDQMDSFEEIHLVNSVRKWVKVKI